MWSKVLVSTFLVLTVAGCATTSKTTSTSQSQQLEARLQEMQSQLQQRDQEIRNLENELERIKAESAQEITGKDLNSAAKPTEKDIQAALKAAGFYNGEIDGKVGPKTKDAIKAFQKANGLKEDGVVGKQTWAKLLTYL
jgi:peptidoglycan hydrolase-like protein with peptidoglycan-binding domain